MGRTARVQSIFIDRPVRLEKWPVMTERISHACHDIGDGHRQ